jgi:MoxR-like ATPase
MSEKEAALEAQIEKIEKVRNEIAKVIVGQKNVIHFVLNALLSSGHVLIEGVPGLGKTMIIKTLSNILNLHFSRLQFTPDLIPSDLIGANIVTQNNSELKLEFEKGPVFANLILADEINRASPKTQSALLEAMQEKAVTVRGIKYNLPSPFLVLATENPLEMEGTYPLPEAQVDRFLFKVFINQPDENELTEILNKTTGTENYKPEIVLEKDELVEIQKTVTEIVIEPNVVNLIVKIISATQPENKNAVEKAKKYFRYGAGPRGAQALALGAKANALMSGRLNAAAEDVAKVARPALRHRIALNFDGLNDAVNTDNVIGEIVEELTKHKKNYAVLS